MKEETRPEPCCKPVDLARREDLKPYQVKELRYSIPLTPSDELGGLAGRYQGAGFDLEYYIWLGGTEVRILPGAYPATFEVVDAYTVMDSAHTYRFPYQPRSDLETDVTVTDNNSR